MPWAYVEIQPITITVEGPLHIGTGYNRGLLQRTVVRDRHGNVYIPATSLKGKVRNACEDVARFYERDGLSVCRAPGPSEMCGGGGSRLCLVCRIFGTPGRDVPEGRALFWHDARLLGSLVTQLRATWRDVMVPFGQTYARTQVQFSRRRGTAAEDRLYTSEYAAEGLRFEAAVEGWLELTPCSVEEGAYELFLLLAGLRLVETLGGARSRAAGRCKIGLPSEVKVRPMGSDPRMYRADELAGRVECLAMYADEMGEM